MTDEDVKAVQEIARLFRVESVVLVRKGKPPVRVRVDELPRYVEARQIKLFDDPR
jgi:hypothetical protein